MFKPAYNLVGCTITDTPALANVMQVDDQTWSYLSELLDDGDWTYAITGVAPTAEVVKIIGVSANLIEVVRGLDGTVPTAYPANTDFYFVMGPSAVLDIMTQNPTASVDVSITGVGSIIVNQVATNQYEISMNELNLTGDETIDVTGAYPDIQIGVKQSANGCCT